MLRNGDVVRLVHEQLNTNLRSQATPGFISKDKYEVSSRPMDKGQDSSEYWVVEVLKDVNYGPGKAGMPIRTLSTTLRFRHRDMGCYLRSGGDSLPDWGWKQLEVTCDPQNYPRDMTTHWNVENHWNERLPITKSHQRCLLYTSPSPRD